MVKKPNSGDFYFPLVFRLIVCNNYGNIRQRISTKLSSIGLILEIYSIHELLFEYTPAIHLSCFINSSWAIEIVSSCCLTLSPLARSLGKKFIKSQRLIISYERLKSFACKIFVRRTPNFINHYSYSKWSRKRENFPSLWEKNKMQRFDWGKLFIPWWY